VHCRPAVSTVKPSDLIDMVLLSCIAMPKSRAESITLYVYKREHCS
jgi:hypothetical protein